MPLWSKRHASNLGLEAFLRKCLTVEAVAAHLWSGGSRCRSPGLFISGKVRFNGETKTPPGPQET
jgi:hypothetical protein